MTPKGKLQVPEDLFAGTDEIEWVEVFDDGEVFCTANLNASLARYNFVCFRAGLLYELYCAWNTPESQPALIEKYLPLWSQTGYRDLSPSFMDCRHLRHLTREEELSLCEQLIVRFKALYARQHDVFGYTLTLLCNLFPNCSFALETEKGQIIRYIWLGANCQDNARPHKNWSGWITLDAQSFELSLSSTLAAS